MTKEAVFFALVSSAISGILGVVISSRFYSRLERRRIKMKTAIKMFGNKHDISGNSFKESINEAIIVFSDSEDVVQNVQNLFQVVGTPKAAKTPDASEEALIKLMKSICKDVGIKHKNLPDSYYLKFFTVPPNA